MKKHLPKLFGAFTLAAGLLSGAAVFAQSANPMDDMQIEAIKTTLSALHAQCDASSDQKACIKQALTQGANAQMPAETDKAGQDFKSCLISKLVDASLGTYQQLFNKVHPSDADIVAGMHQIEGGTDQNASIQNCIASSGLKLGN